jgi:transcriptional regulator with XRE-family HTH domain
MEKSAHTREGEHLRDLLKELREERGFTQESLARKLEAPQSLVSKYESGERRIDLIELRFVCSALDLTLTDFINRWEKRLK